MATDRRFRFAAQLSFVGSHEAWAAKARRVEELGDATLCVPDHFEDQVLAMPNFAIGTVAQIAGELERRRDELGPSYVVVGGECHEAMAPVVARPAGT